MRTTPNLGLKVYNLPGDDYDPQDLEDNWDAIDAAANAAAPASRIQKLDDDLALAALPTLANTAADIGTLIYLDIPITGYDTHTIVRWNGTAWRNVGQPAIMSSLPTVGNYQGRLVALTGASGGFAANDVVVNTDGANAWKKIGGVASGAALPGTPTAGDVFLLTSAAGGFEAYSFVAYTGSAWVRLEKRGVEVGAALPGTPYTGQVYVVTAATGGFLAYDVVRWNGSTWHRIGPGPGKVMGFSAYANASQSPAASTWTKVSYNTEVFDTEGWYDSATNYRFTPLLAGKYRFNITVYASDAVNSGTILQVALYKNGTAHALVDYKVIGTGVTTPGIYGGEVVVEANGTTDYFEVFYHQSDSIARAIHGSANAFLYNRFQGEFIGA